MGFGLVRIIAIIMLLVATQPLPYDYYTLLRVVVFVVSAYGVFFSYKKSNDIWIWVFGLVAVLFNPLFPIYLEKNTWIFIDYFVAMVFLVSFWMPDRLTIQQTIIGVSLIAIVVVASLWTIDINNLYYNLYNSTLIISEEVMSRRLAQINQKYGIWFIGLVLNTVLFIFLSNRNKRRDKKTMN